MSDDHSSSEAPASDRRWGRRFRNAVLGTLMLVLGGLLGIVLLLQTEWASTHVAQWAAERFNPVDGTTLTVERASGTWFSNLTLYEIAWTLDGDAHPDTDDEARRLATVDTVSVTYALPALLRGTLHLHDAHVGGPTVYATEAADTTWNWTPVLQAFDTDDDPDDEPFPVRIDQAELTRGAATLSFHSETDSTATIDALDLSVRDLQVSDTFAATLDALQLHASLPDQPRTPLTLNAAAALTPEALAVEHIQLDAPRSRLRSTGVLNFAAEASPLDSLDAAQFNVQADSLAIADLTPFLPGLAPASDEVHMFELEVRQHSGTWRSTGSGSVEGAGTWTLDAEATPPREAVDQLRFRTDIDVANYRTRLIGDETILNARIDADFRGPTLDALDGTARIDVRNSQFERMAIETIDGAVTLDNGTASLDANARINNAALRVQGTTTPFEEVPAYDFRASIDDFDAATWLPDADLTARLNLDATLEGQGLTPDNRDLTASINLRPSTINDLNIERFTSTTRLQGEQVETTGTLDVPGGRLTASASAALDGSETFALNEIRTTNFNLNAFLDDDTLPDTRVTMQASATGTGFDPDTMTLDGTATLDQTAYGMATFDRLRAAFEWEAGTVTTTLNAEGNWGRFESNLEARPLDTPLALTLREGRLTDLDLGPFLQDPDQHTALNGRFHATVEQPEGRAPTGRLSTELTSSRINDQLLESATLEADIDADERLTFDLSLQAPDDARARLAGTARPFDDRPAFEVDEGSFDAINLGAFAGSETLDTDLNGTLAGTGRGATLDDLSLDGSLTLAPSRINEAQLNEAQLALHAQDGAVDGTLDARFDVGTAHAAFDLSLPDSSYTIDVRADQFDGAALTGQDTLDADLDELRLSVSGSGWTPETAAFDAELDLHEAAYDAITVDQARLRARYAEGDLSVDSFTLTSNVLTADAQGNVAVFNPEADSDIQLNVELIALQPLEAVTGQRTLSADTGTLEGRLRGEGDGFRFNGQVDIENLVVNDIRVSDLETTVAGALDGDRTLTRVESRNRLNFVDLAAFAAEEARINLNYTQTDGATMTSTIRLDPQRSAQIDVGVPSFDPDEPLVALIDRFDMHLDGDSWALLQPATLTQDGSAVRLSNFLVSSSDQQIAADGRIDPQGTQSMIATLENIDVAPFVELVDIEGLGGTLNGSFTLTGAADDPSLDGQLDFDVQSEGESIGTLDSQLTYSDLALDIQADLTHVDGSTLAFNGDFPIDLRLDTATEVEVMDSPLDLSLQADDFAINWINPFLDPATIQELEGRFDADIQVAGTRSDPELQGDALVDDLSIVFTELETRYRDGVAQLRLDDDQIRVESADIRSSGGGRLQANGVINLAELTLGEMDLNVRADNFMAINTRAYRRGTINGRMTLGGTTERPRLTGRVQVVRAEIFYDEIDEAAAEDLDAVSLTDEDRVTLERRFGIRLADSDAAAYDTFQAMAMDLEVEIRRETWLRSRSATTLNIQFNGDLDLQKAHDEDLELYGSIDIVPARSTVEQFGQLFRIDEGALSFDGPVDDPQMNFAAVYEQRARETRDVEVTITLNAEGRLGNLSLDLSSDPPMSTSNILSYLATGRPADSFLAGGGSGGDLAAQLAIGQASSFVENLAAQQLGLDVVRLQVRPNGISYLTVGRYITPRFYASIEQPINTQGNEAQVLEPDLLLEYELTNTVMSRLIRRESSLRFNFLYERAY